MDKYKIDDCVNTVSDMVNNMSLDYKTFAVLFSNQHPTLQQNFTRLCVAWLEQCAKLKKLNRYDLRNEDSVNLGEAFMALDERVRYLRNI